MTNESIFPIRKITLTPYDLKPNASSLKSQVCPSQKRTQPNPILSLFPLSPLRQNKKTQNKPNLLLRLCFGPPPQNILDRGPFKTVR